MSQAAPSIMPPKFTMGQLHYRQKKCITCRHREEDSILLSGVLFGQCHINSVLKIKNHIKAFVIFIYSIFLLFEISFQILKIIPESSIMADLNYGFFILKFLQKYSLFFIITALYSRKNILCFIVQSSFQAQWKHFLKHFQSICP